MESLVFNQMGILSWRIAELRMPEIFLVPWIILSFIQNGQFSHKMYPLLHTDHSISDRNGSQFIKQIIH